MPKKTSKGVRMKVNGPLVPWSEWCKVWGHHFRSNGTCVCGEKNVQRKS